MGHTALFVAMSACDAWIFFGMEAIVASITTCNTFCAGYMLTCSAGVKHFLVFGFE